MGKKRTKRTVYNLLARSKLKSFFLKENVRSAKLETQISLLQKHVLFCLHIESYPDGWKTFFSSYMTSCLQMEKYRIQREKEMEVSTTQ